MNAPFKQSGFYTTVHQEARPDDRRTYWNVEHFRVFGEDPRHVLTQYFKDRAAAERYIGQLDPDVNDHVVLRAGFDIQHTDAVASYWSVLPPRRTWFSGFRRRDLPHSPFLTNGELYD